jgi:hypothetical protein
MYLLCSLIIVLPWHIITIVLTTILLHFFSSFRLGTCFSRIGGSGRQRKSECIEDKFILPKTLGSLP